MSGAPIFAEATFARSLDAPASARRWLAAQMAASGWPASRIETAVTIAGELVTNVIRHAGSDPVVTATETKGVLRCGVHDDNPARPVLTAADHEPENGSGMRLVDALARSWGVEESTCYVGGKQVWFEITRLGVAPQP